MYPRRRSALGAVAALLVAVAVKTVGGATDRGACGELFGSNILAAGGMEDWRAGAPLGWSVVGTCGPDERVRAGGKRSARLEVPAKGRAKLASEPIPVEPGYYFLRYVFRQDVPEAREGSYARESYATVECLGADGQILRSAYVFGSELAVPSWRYRHRIFNVPAGAKAIRINLFFVNHVGRGKPCALWVDQVEVCPYHRPADPGGRIRATFVPSLGRAILATDGGAGHRVFEGALAYAESSSPWGQRDPKSVSGLARRWPGRTKGQMFWNSAPVRGLSPGVYRLSLKIRTERVEVKDGNRPVIQMTASYPHINSIGHGRILASQLRADGEYHDYSIDLVKPDAKPMKLRIDALSQAPEFWLDYVVLRPLRRFTDADNRCLFPALFEPPPPLPNPTEQRAVVLVGLCSEQFRLEEALRQAGIRRIDRVLYRISYNEGPALEGMPQSYKELARYTHLIVANVPLRAVGPEVRFRILHWVRSGGVMVILGGKMAYGASGLKGSFLDEVLPIQVADNDFDIRPAGGPIAAADEELTAGLSGVERVIAPYIHEVRHRPGSRVIISVDDTPGVVLGCYGRGRVACVAVPPYGSAPKGRIVLWAWKEWPTLLARVLTWTGRAVR